MDINIIIKKKKKKKKNCTIQKIIALIYPY